MESSDQEYIIHLFLFFTFIITFIFTPLQLAQGYSLSLDSDAKLDFLEVDYTAGNTFKLAGMYKKTIIYILKIF